MVIVKIEVILIILFCSFNTILLGQSLSYTPNELLVKWQSNSIPTQRTNIKTQFNLKQQVFLPNSDIELWKIADTTDLLNSIQIYKNHPNIKSIEPNYIYTTATTPPNDPMFDKLWSMNNTGQIAGAIGADINAIAGWAIQKESPSIQIAILDTGIDWRHPDLVDNIWQNLGEDADGDGHVLEWDGTKWIFDPGDENGIDDDGNGYIDDFIGWDFVNNDNDPYDDHGHGTHVAGIIGATGDNGIGITGVTWKVQLVPLKFISKENRGRNSNAIEAINYATAMGIPISNNSWGGRGNSSFLKEAIDQSGKQNHLFIAAAGNDNNNNDITPNYPAAYTSDNIISVAATTDKDSLLFISEKKGSNYGATTVDLGAPGYRILSCLPNNNYELADGTSMAAPLVTGACALLLEQNKTLTYGAIKERILTGVDVVPALQGKTVSGGRLNLYRVFEGCDVLRDSLALVAFYHALDGPNWKNKWDLRHPIRTWYGITTSAGGCVIKLAIHHNDLTGEFPREIGRLANLQTFSVTGKITGELPSTIGELTNLQSIYLQGNPQGNQLTGHIPVEIGKLTKLVSLNLQGNNLTGSIPVEIGELTNLATLNLSGNDLTGNIPSSIGNLVSLQTIYIQDNHFTGNIPTTIGKLFDLSILYLNNNQLTGTIPTEIGQLTELSLLQLDNNSLTGIIPTEIGRLTKLRSLNLRINQLEGNIPAELGGLPSLSGLILSYNKLSGCFPQSLSNHCNIIYDFSKNPDLPNDGDFDAFCDNGTGGCSIASCRTLDSLNLINLYQETNGPNWVNQWDFNQPIKTWYGIETNEYGCVTHILLSNNNLTGAIPPEIGNLEELLYLHLDSNQLTDIIPSEIGNLKELKSLQLNQNQLSENIPAEIGNLINLERLDLSANQLTTKSRFELVGNIPIELGNLVHLKWLDLSNNQLGGEIPSIISTLTKLQGLNLAHNQLIGNIPNEITNLDSLVTISIENNQLTGSIPEAFGFLSNLQTVNFANNQLSGCFPASLANLCFIDCDFSSNPALPYSGGFDAFCDTGIGGCTTCRTTDSLALIALYNAADGPNWKNTWNLEAPIDTWFGIETNEYGCVTAITFRPDHLLKGTIPVELGQLALMEKLSLEGQFTGSIPKEIGNLSNLKILSLSGDLTGNIPTELGNLINLEWLFLVRTQLTGSIPSELGNLVNLQRLLIGYNQLTGNIPTTIGNLTNLQVLYLSNNQLEGTIPKELGQLNATLDINLSNNQLSGSIPKELGNLTRVSRLYLNNNQLNNKIPAELGQLVNLQRLYLNDNLLSGAIPAELGQLNRIEKLYLNNNKLSGSLSSELGSLDNLKEFFINNNLLRGCFPSSFSSLCAIDAYDFSNNSNLPNNGDFNDFCNNGAADCQEPVWPGDFNNDGIVNNADALFWGLACENQSGLVRPNASIEWYPQASPDWPNAVNTINNKHQDGNGDGQINLADLAALHENYGKESTISFSTSNTEGVNYRLDPLSIEETSETTILKYALHVELNDTPVALHGLACTINFGDLAIPDSPTLDLSNSSLIPDTSVVKFNTEENTLDIALTRTDKTNQLCDGAVGVLVIILADHVAFGESILLSIKNGNRISADGTFNAIAGTSSTSFAATASSEIFISTAVVHEQCDRLGSAVIMVSDENPYSIKWSTGANTSKITNLTAGDYSATITHSNNRTDTINIEIEGQFLPIYDENGELQDCGLQTCPPIMTLTNDELVDNTYQAGKTITASSNQATGSNITFKAGESITLKPGFAVTAGSTFSAIIEACDTENANNNINSRQIITKPIAATSITPPEQLSMDIFPNPVDHKTTIAYFLPSTGKVHLAILNSNGRQMKTLLNGVFREAGRQEIDFFVDDLDSGVYFVVLQTKNGIKTKKVVLLQ